MFFGCIVLDFHAIVNVLRKHSREIFVLLRDSGSERKVLDVLSSFLPCKRDVRYCSYPGLIVDLLCGDLGIEVEFNKQPHIGLDQAIAYRVFLGLRPILLHVVEYCTLEFKETFKKLLKSLKCLDIKGIIIDVGSGEIVVLE